MESMAGGNCSPYMYAPRSMYGRHGYTIEFSVRKGKNREKHGIQIKKKISIDFKPSESKPKIKYTPQINNKT